VLSQSNNYDLAHGNSHGKALKILQRGIYPLKERSTEDIVSYLYCKEIIDEIARQTGNKINESVKKEERSTFDTYEQVNKFLFFDNDISNLAQSLGAGLLLVYGRYGIVEIRHKIIEGVSYYDLGEWNKNQSKKTLTSILSESNLAR
jgi:hypothetical protein